MVAEDGFEETLLGADEVVMSNDPNAMQAHTASFDLIVDTVSAEHDLNAYVNLLKLDATHVLLGAPDRPTLVSAFPLLWRQP